MNEDIWELATASVDRIRHVHDSANKARVIYDAILAERKRCAEVARVEAKRYDTPHGSQPAYLAAYMIAERIEAGQ